MVQGYTQEDNSRSGFGCSFTGSRNAGNSFSYPGTKAGSGYPAFFEYRISNPGGYPHEQWCSYQSEKFKLRRFEKPGRETGEYRFFSEIVKGCRDYEHLLPLTIRLD